MLRRQRFVRNTFESENSALSVRMAGRRNMNSHESASTIAKTNFISDSVLPEGPRAVAVTETGEKRLLPYDISVLKLIGSTNQIQHEEPKSAEKLKKSTAAPVSMRQSPAKSRAAAKDRPSVNGKNIKAHVSRRYTVQRMRPIFTPRIIPNTKRSFSANANRGCSYKMCYNAQTQTNILGTRLQVSRTTRTSTALPQSPKSGAREPAMELALQRRHEKSITTQAIGDSPRQGYNNNMCCPNDYNPWRPCDNNPEQALENAPRRCIEENPTHLSRPHNRSSLFAAASDKPPTTVFSEIRSLASVLTFVWIMFFVLLNYFQLQDIYDTCQFLWRALQFWRKPIEPPLTFTKQCTQYIRRILHII